MRTELKLVTVAGVLLVSGLGSHDAAEATSGSAGPLDGVDLVVIGDSLLNPSGVCEGCTGFVEQYATNLGESLGVPAAADTVPGGGVPEALQSVAEDDGARSLIVDAEVVVVEVGYNNALPDPDTGIGCGGSMGGGYIVWLDSPDDECLVQGVVTYGQLYDQIFAGIKELRAGQPTVLVVTNTIDGNIDPSIPDGLLGIAGDRVDEVRAWAVDVYDRWNEMLAARAAAAGFELVDLYHEFNGPRGDQPFGSLSVDGAHPSQEGNDLIASKLAEVDLSALEGAQVGS